MEEIVASSVTPLFGGPIPFGVFHHELIGDLRVKTRSQSQHSDGLFVDDIWPGSLFLAEFLLTHTFLCQNKDILEISAGASLPSLVASKLFPKSLVVTDFPSCGILENIQESFEQNSIDPCSYQILGYKWGEDVSELLKKLPENKLFDLMILSEVLWRDTYPQHRY
jgi:predicted nicotinamide N-methyase